jgi:Ser-tRNA(Ala) deacylase AlaX
MSNSQYKPASFFMTIGEKPKSVQAVHEQMKAHSVPRVKVGKEFHYHLERGIAAAHLGSQLNKNKAAEEIAKMEEIGIDPENIIYKTKLAQLKKIELQCDQLKTELEKTQEKLADREEVRAYWVRIYSDIISMIRTWKESETAKNPNMRVHIKGLSDGLIASMKDVLESNK